MSARFRLTKWYVYLLVLSGLGLNHILVFNRHIVPYNSLGPLGRFFHLLAFDHSSLLAAEYAIAWLIHILEAIYAFILTKRANFTFTEQLLWTGQTILLGNFSLLPLKRMLKEYKNL